MIERTATIQNQQGIHCRPSAVIIKEFQHYPGSIRVSNEVGQCDLHSVMQLLGLGLQQGHQVTIQVEGPEEAFISERLVKAFETHFDFPPVEEDSRSASRTGSG